jgi:hypothetical protein
MKPKINRAGDPQESKGYDRCMTPAYALDPLLPYIRPNWIVWECAAGTGNLYEALAHHTLGIIGTDIHGEHARPARDFFAWQPDIFDAIVTNPPYSIKFDWLERCYQFGRPFALLVPVEMIGAQSAQRLMERHGAELLLLNRRVNFIMPNKGLSGGGAQFPVLWLCWKMLPSPIVYGKLTQRADEQVMMQLEAA